MLNHQADGGELYYKSCAFDTKPARELEEIHKDNDLRFQVIDQNNDNSSDEEEELKLQNTKALEPMGLLYDLLQTDPVQEIQM